MDCSLSGSSVHGIFQAKILEWIAIFLLQGIYPGIKLGSPALQAESLLFEPPGEPFGIIQKLPLLKIN